VVHLLPASGVSLPSVRWNDCQRGHEHSFWFGFKTVVAVKEFDSLLLREIISSAPKWSAGESWRNGRSRSLPVRMWYQVQRRPPPRPYSDGHQTLPILFNPMTRHRTTGAVYPIIKLCLQRVKHPDRNVISRNLLRYLLPVPSRSSITAIVPRLKVSHP
jgi:hypothetical protein